MVEGLNYTYDSQNLLSNDVCLPRSQKIHWQYLAQVLLIAAAQLLLALFEAYGLRLRRVIAAAFYRKRKPAFSLPCFKGRSTKCIVCVTKLKKSEIEQCKNEMCAVTYCQECWNDVKVRLSTALK
ncbi:uncharacterized protein [Watersipora subatra]|uniref:uncharacterized protein n=1 Tax=Watersipora subatra TaxID=2589382 RepID=UPI00355C1EA4